MKIDGLPLVFLDAHSWMLHLDATLCQVLQPQRHIKEQIQVNTGPYWNFLFCFYWAHYTLDKFLRNLNAGPKLSGRSVIIENKNIYAQIILFVDNNNNNKLKKKKIIICVCVVVVFVVVF